MKNEAGRGQNRPEKKDVSTQKADSRVLTVCLLCGDCVLAVSTDCPACPRPSCPAQQPWVGATGLHSSERAGSRLDEGGRGNGGGSQSELTQ